MVYLAGARPDEQRPDVSHVLQSSRRMIWTTLTMKTMVSWIVRQMCVLLGQAQAEGIEFTEVF